MFDMSKTLEDQDPQIAKAIRLEEQRQEEHVELMVANSLMMRSRWQSSAPSSCSAPTMPTCNHTQDRRRMRLRAWRCSIRAIRCWV